MARKVRLLKVVAAAAAAGVAVAVAWEVECHGFLAAMVEAVAREEEEVVVVAWQPLVVLLLVEEPRPNAIACNFH